MITLFHDHASPASAVAVFRLHPLLDEGLVLDVVGYRSIPLEAPIRPPLTVLEELERHRADAAALGLTLRRPRRLPPTTGAHLVEQMTDDPQDARRFRELAYRALWERGDDLAAADVLCRLAEQAGLDPVAVRVRLGDQQEVARLTQRLSGARSVHVGGVPTLDVDGTLVSAFIPLDDVRRLARL